MSNVSLEYAKALYDLAIDDNRKQMLSMLDDSIQIIEGDVYRFLSHPEIDAKVKKDIIDKSFSNQLFKNFLFVLIDNSRISLLEDIKYEYKNLLLKDESIIDAVCYSKEKLSESYLNSLKKKLETKLNKSVYLRNEIDESIIGGIKIKYESKEIDMTINSKFNDLLAKLKE